MAFSESDFETLVRELVGRPGVAVGSGKRGFGSDALTVYGRIFAMLTRGHLVLKLPAERVADLIASGAGAPFDAGKGKPMREWVTLIRASDGQPRELAEAAMSFVGGGRG